EKVAQAEIAFFGGSFTAINREYMVSLLKTAADFVGESMFSGIRISTRPDAINDEILTILKQYHVTSIELGAQSMCDDILTLNFRGHTADCVRKASKLIKDYGFNLGLQMMIGLYGDSEQAILYTADEIIKLQPKTVRIYPTIVIKDTHLETLYKNEEYIPYTVNEAVGVASKIYRKFISTDITVIRLGLHASKTLEKDMLAGPYHPAFKELCESKIVLENLLLFLEEKQIPKGAIKLFVNPKSVSIFVGQRKSNIHLLEEKQYFTTIVQDVTISRYDFVLVCA
ncbi:MAG: radical SAM protein, partial [Oscillospiraceae bacterium]